MGEKKITKYRGDPKGKTAFPNQVCLSQKKKKKYITVRGNRKLILQEEKKFYPIRKGLGFGAEKAKLQSIGGLYLYQRTDLGIRQRGKLKSRGEGGTIPGEKKKKTIIVRKSPSIGGDRVKGEKKKRHLSNKGRENNAFWG